MIEKTAAQVDEDRGRGGVPVPEAAQGEVVCPECEHPESHHLVGIGCSEIGGYEAGSPVWCPCERGWPKG
jgi:hypothetical protein